MASCFQEASNIDSSGGVEGCNTTSGQLPKLPNERRCYLTSFSHVRTPLASYDSCALLACAAGASSRADYADSLPLSDCPTQEKP